MYVLLGQMERERQLILAHPRQEQFARPGVFGTAPVEHVIRAGERVAQGEAAPSVDDVRLAARERGRRRVLAEQLLEIPAQERHSEDAYQILGPLSVQGQVSVNVIQIESPLKTEESLVLIIAHFSPYINIFGARSEKISGRAPTPGTPRDIQLSGARRLAMANSNFPEAKPPHESWLNRNR